MTATTWMKLKDRLKAISKEKSIHDFLHEKNPAWSSNKTRPSRFFALFKIIAKEENTQVLLKIRFAFYIAFFP